MVQLLRDIANLLQAISDIIIMLIDSFLNLFGLIPRGAVFLGQVATYMPAVFQSFIIAGISLSIALLVLGRN